MKDQTLNYLIKEAKKSSSKPENFRALATAIGIIGGPDAVTYLNSQAKKLSSRPEDYRATILALANAANKC